MGDGDKKKKWRSFLHFCLIKSSGIWWEHNQVIDGCPKLLMRCDQLNTYFYEIFNERVSRWRFWKIICYISIFLLFWLKRFMSVFCKRRGADRFFSAKTIRGNSVTEMFWVWLNQVTCHTHFCLIKVSTNESITRLLMAV